MLKILLTNLEQNNEVFGFEKIPISKYSIPLFRKHLWLMAAESYPK